MREDDARQLASLINGDWGFEWEAEVQPAVAGYCVVATFDKGGVHRLYSRLDWDDARELVYGEDEEE